MHAMSATDGCCARFRDSEVPDLALRLEPHHRPDRILDRDRLVDAVDVIEINRVGEQPSQAPFTGFDNVFRLAIGGGLAVGQTNVAELRREDVALAAPRSEEHTSELQSRV